MPRCVKCDKFFHPDYSVLMNPDTEDKACKCVFCYTEKKQVSIQDEETGKTEKVVTKKQAEEEYRRYIHDLRHEEKIIDVLSGKVPARPKTRH
jgi:hypothetical protein